MIITNDNYSWEFIRKFGPSGEPIGIALNVRYIPERKEETYGFFRELQESIIVPQERGIIVQENQIVIGVKGRDFKIALNTDDRINDQSDLLILYSIFSDDLKIIIPNIVVKNESAKLSVWYC